MIDRYLQRRFDALFHWLMRTTGCTKRQIRWHLWLGFIVPLMLKMVPWGEQWQSPYLWPVLAIGVPAALLVMWFYGTWMQREHDADLIAERLGMASVSDHPRNARTCKMLGCFYLACGLPLMVWALCSSRYAVPGDRVLDAFAGVAMLAQGYLCRTPPTPPPKETRALDLHAVESA